MLKTKRFNMDNPLYLQTVIIGGETTTYNAPKVLGIRVHADQSFDLQYTLVKGETGPFDIASSTSEIYVTAYKNSSYSPVLLASGAHTDSGSGTTDRVTFTVPAEAIPNDIANFPLRNPGNAVFYAIITDGTGKKIEIVAEVNIFDTQYSLTGDAAPSAQTIIPIKNDLGSVISSNLTVPPTATLNNAYIVAAGASGDWAGQDNDLAIGTGTAWVFFTPLEGNFVYDENQNIQIIFNGSAWSGLDSAPFTDANAIIKNDADATKLIKIDAAGIATGTTRTITMPNANVDLGALGDVSGPAGSVDDRIATFDGVTGKLLQDSGSIVSDFMQDLVDDATPQLGGFLDAQDNRVSNLLGLGLKATTVLDIAAGAIVQTQMIHNVGTEAAVAADDLDSIVPANGQTEILITMNDAAEVPTIKHATGTNTFLLPDDTDVLMVMHTFYHFHHDGTNWKLVGSAANGGGGSALSVAVYQDQKSNGTMGGSSSGGTYVTRTLNTEVSDVDNIATLSSNAVTPIAGTYLVTAYAPGRSVGTHRIDLHDGTSYVITGVDVEASAASSSPSIISGVITTAGSTAYTIQHFTQVTIATTGLGVASTTGQIEGYALITFTKIG